jgi:hypothetical protein
MGTNDDPQYVDTYFGIVPVRPLSRRRRTRHVTSPDEEFSRFLQRNEYIVPMDALIRDVTEKLNRMYSIRLDLDASVINDWLPK